MSRHKSAEIVQELLVVTDTVALLSHGLTVALSDTHWIREMQALEAATAHAAVLARKLQHSWGVSEAREPRLLSFAGRAPRGRTDGRD